ncbi:MAG: SPW repeat domain-containing protein [Candidatus Limnocylindria bacterium]
MISIAAGIWLMAAPAALGYGDPARTSDVVVGPLMASFGVVSIWQATRGLRWLVTLAGVWLLAAPWLLGYTGPAFANSLLSGVVAVIAGLLHGGTPATIGGGWKAIWKEETR